MQSNIHIPAGENESGRVLNDAYTKAEYVSRRLGVLGRTPFWSENPACLAKVRRDADEVFDDGAPRLSVQEIRSREILREVDPLLPLPTTENTESLNSFRGYPEHEWVPGDKSPGVGMLGGRAPSASPPIGAGTIRQRSEPVGLRSTAASPCRQASEPAYQSSSPVRDRTIRAPLKTKTAPAGKSARKAPAAPQPATKTAAKPRRGRKRAIDDTDTEDDDDDNIIVRPAKKAKIGTTSKSSRAVKVPPASSAGRAPKRPALGLEGVITGGTLPKSRADAEGAATERYNRLLAAHKITKPNDPHPNLDEEFFDKRNFTPAEWNGSAVRCLCGHQSGPGEGDIDFIGCETNNCVWQHVPCMGEPARRDRDRANARYLCHRCDPFKHRKVLQSHRLDTPIE